MPSGISDSQGKQNPLMHACIDTKYTYTIHSWMIPFLYLNSPIRKHLSSGLDKLPAMRVCSDRIVFKYY